MAENVMAESVMAGNDAESKTPEEWQEEEFLRLAMDLSLETAYGPSNNEARGGDNGRGEKVLYGGGDHSGEKGRSVLVEDSRHHDHRPPSPDGNSPLNDWMDPCEEYPPPARVEELSRRVQYMDRNRNRPLPYQDVYAPPYHAAGAPQRPVYPPHPGYHPSRYPPHQPYPHDPRLGPYPTNQLQGMSVGYPYPRAFPPGSYPRLPPPDFGPYHPPMHPPPTNMQVMRSPPYGQNEVVGLPPSHRTHISDPRHSQQEHPYRPQEYPSASDDPGFSHSHPSRSQRPVTVPNKSSLVPSTIIGYPDQSQKVHHTSSPLGLLPQDPSTGQDNMSNLDDEMDEDLKRALEASIKSEELRKQQEKMREKQYETEVKQMLMMSQHDKSSLKNPQAIQYERVEPVKDLGSAMQKQQSSIRSSTKQRNGKLTTQTQPDTQNQTTQSSSFQPSNDAKSSDVSDSMSDTKSQINAGFTILQRRGKKSSPKAESKIMSECPEIFSIDTSKNGDKNTQSSSVQQPKKNKSSLDLVDKRSESPAVSSTDTSLSSLPTTSPTGSSRDTLNLSDFLLEANRDIASGKKPTLPHSIKSRIKPFPDEESSTPTNNTAPKETVASDTVPCLPNTHFGPMAATTNPASTREVANNLNGRLPAKIQTMARLRSLRLGEEGGANQTQPPPSQAAAAPEPHDTSRGRDVHPKKVIGQAWTGFKTGLAGISAGLQQRKNHQAAGTVQAPDTSVSILDLSARREINMATQDKMIKGEVKLISHGTETAVYYAARGDNVRGFDVAIKFFKQSWSLKNPASTPNMSDPDMAKREFDNLKRAKSANVRVPTPIELRSNVIFMEFIGSKGQAVPKLAQVPQAGKKKALYRQIMEAIRVLFVEASLIHGSLSEKNILVASVCEKDAGNLGDEQIMLVDFLRAVDTKHKDAATKLTHDLQFVRAFFSCHEVKPLSLAQAEAAVKSKNPIDWEKV